MEEKIVKIIIKDGIFSHFTEKRLKNIDFTFSLKVSYVFYIGKFTNNELCVYFSYKLMATFQ